jgi:peptidoglycan/LPS O-acetylase OafA/YrhL
VVARRTGHERLRGLDGLRAVAVMGVLLYHANERLLPGGFLGVDLFFVISGFLITYLLVTERQRNGTISLRAFYLRRARRLLPALFAMLATAAGFMAVFFRGDLHQARGDIGAALGYVSNWWYVLHHRSYFVAAGRPEPLQHLWSLAVEEQFYLIWPALLVLLLLGRVRLRIVAAVALGGALASAWWMRELAVAGNVPYDTDASRLYFGTDTHASALLLGVAAAALVLWRRSRKAGDPAQVRVAGGTAGGAAGRRIVDGVVVGAGVLAVGGVCWAMWSVSQFSPSIYRGGFLAFAAVAAVAVASASRSGSPLGRALDVGPLRWIGERSYGLYLWHWPVFVYTRPTIDWSLHGWSALAARFAITFALTELCFRFVERPIREHGLAPVRPVLVPVVGAVASVAMLAAMPALLTGWLAGRQPATIRAAAAATAARPAIGTPQPAHTTSGPATPTGAPTSPRPGDPTAGPATATGTPSSSGPHPSTAAPGAARTATPTTTTAAQPPGSAAAPTGPPSIPAGPPPMLTAVGDSIMIDATKALQTACPSTEVYAVVGWQAKAMFGQIAALSNAHHLGRIVVIEAGTNGVVSPKELEATLSLLADRDKVVIVNNHMDRPWEPANNALFPQAVKNHPNAVVVDWDTLANKHPDWLTKDNVHLLPSGRAAYADLIAQAAGC